MTDQNPEDQGESNQTERMWLPGFGANGRAGQPADFWPAAPADPPDLGRARRRRSTWTTGALIAGGAVVTGYLAYSVVAATPAPSSGSKASTTGTSANSPSATPTPTTRPTLHLPIGTTGGSGATGHHDDGNGGDN